MKMIEILNKPFKKIREMNKEELLKIVQSLRREVTLRNNQIRWYSNQNDKLEKEVMKFKKVKKQFEEEVNIQVAIETQKLNDRLFRLIEKLTEKLR